MLPNFLLFFHPFLLLSPTSQSRQLLKTIQALCIYPETQNGSLGAQICCLGQTEACHSWALLPRGPGHRRLRAQGLPSLSPALSGLPACTSSSSLTAFTRVPSLGLAKTNGRRLHMGRVCLHSLNAESPDTLPLFPSHVDAVKNGTKKGKRTRWLLVTTAEKQKAISVG